MLMTIRPYSKGMRARKGVQGFSLIEVLVSVLLAAIGLLALSGANVVSIRYSKMSQYRGTATMLAADLAERMRSNQAGLANYEVADDFAAQASSPSASTACETYSSTCTSAQLAAYDLVNWKLLVRNQLPQGSVFVTPSTSVLAADVWVAWKDPAVANPSENSTDARDTSSKECPNSFSNDQSVRCAYFRINI